ncbi:MAG: saccharopine dehydrogenase NADP-binding domain-containing protein, partial [Gemmatimonadales bacterium]
MIAGDFLLYGATGYTGELIARRAASLGLRPILSGRSLATVGALAIELDLEHRIASVDDAKALDAAINALPEANRTVLNCAGPFSHTAKQVAEACLRNGAHYLDITGEITVFEMMAAKTKAAEKAGLMLLPGVGFDVVPSDCLAAYVASRLQSATKLVIAIQGVGKISRGTMLTSIQNIGNGGAVRRGGAIVRVPSAWKSRTVTFDNKPVQVTTMPWGDVATSFYSTRIPDIEVYMMIPDGMRKLLK